MLVIVASLIHPQNYRPLIPPIVSHAQAWRPFPSRSVPTFKDGTDHTREYVPVLAYGPDLAPGVDLGTRATFADMGATVEEHLGLEPVGPGTSFLPELAGALT